jgi:hypothetical protein
VFLNENMVKKAFKRVKEDVLSLKTSVNEWILFLNSNQRTMKLQLVALEKKVAKLEAKLGSSQIQELRNI